MVAWPDRLDQIEALRYDGAIDLVGATHWKRDGEGDLFARPVPDHEFTLLADCGIGTVADALLAWVLAHPAVTTTIPATARPARARSNAAAAAAVTIDDDTRNRISGWFT